MKKETYTKKQSTSWEPVEKWYNEAVGEEGHYYHQHIVMPGVLKLLDLASSASPSILDLACGQGILARHISKGHYYGIDIAPALIKAARNYDPNQENEYQVGDIAKPFNLKKKDFTHAAFILAAQNIENPLIAFKNAFAHLQSNGKFILVINHPCFRIPRQSSWKIDPEQKIQFRRIDRYFSPMKIPIQMQPSKGKKSIQTLSFHYPLSSYFQWMQKAGFVIETIEEWCSDKRSTGKFAKMENRSREEFPLFLAISAKKL